MARKRVERIDRLRMTNRVFIDILKENLPCTDCKNFFIAPVMEFDHIHSKVATVADMLKNELSLKTILKEIKKCELVCANCHRIRTTKRRKSRTSRSPHN